MEWLPLFFRLTGHTCLLVGGGTVALRKARLLEKTGAVICVVAPRIDADLARIVQTSGGFSEPRAFAVSDLERLPALVIAATSDEQLNRTVAEAANQMRIPVNVVDTPDLCTVIFPSIVDRSPLLLALSSGGRAPVLLRQWRERLEALLPARLGELADFAGAFRERVKAALPDVHLRRRFWEDFFSGTGASALLSGQPERGKQLLEESLAKPAPVQGEVYLVGAGPGDPDLLTLRALRLMQQADTVLYDNLVSRAVLELCRRDSELIYVGKKRKYKIFRQEEITQLMIARARKGERVLRLKGGDPFVFGRGGEEMLGLAQQQVTFQVVPGITAANGCAAYAGIPLTHRDYAQSVRFVTGHLKQDEICLDWPELEKPDQTLVFYMGRKNLPRLVNLLLSRGRAPDTPVALIENGTMPNQKVWVSTLSGMDSLLETIALTGPTVAIIGDVVRLRTQLGYASDKG